MVLLTPQQTIDQLVTRMVMEHTLHRQLEGEAFPMFQLRGSPRARPREELRWLVSPFTKSAGRSRGKQRRKGIHAMKKTCWQP